MNKGGFLAALVILGYLAFELYTINKARYRMEKPYIFDQFVSADAAHSACRPSKDEMYRKFQHNFELMRTRTELELANPDVSTKEVRQIMTDRIKTRRKDVDDLINSKGCADPEVWKLLRRFEIFAGKNIG